MKESLKERLKRFVVDNLLATVLSTIGLFTSGYLLANNIFLPLRTLWFILFFINFIVLMYNIVVLIRVDNLKGRFIQDVEELTKKD